MKQSQTNGIDKTITALKSITADNNKYGRELLKSRDEIIKRLVYGERSVEEHENVSAHICPAELSKIYAEHLRDLEARSIQPELSVNENKVVYINNQSFVI
jgi:hypothetical protein